MHKKTLATAIIITIGAGCTNVRPLVDSSYSSSEFESLDSVIVVTGDPAISYKIKNMMKKKLHGVSKKLQQYKIYVQISEEGDVSAYSEKEVVKEYKRLSAQLRIVKENETIAQTKLDAASQYEVNDNLPYASLSSKNVTTDLLIENIANETSNFVLLSLH